ncbi:MAG: hypothetical protein HY695_19670 [Deltaproteobacteria bacterium]|nr:hypothetical protein [Deltaproteobacteria bacterium]
MVRLCPFRGGPTANIDARFEPHPASSACEFEPLLIAKEKKEGQALIVRFEKEIEIKNSRQKVWDFIWDVDRFIACIPGCKEAQTVEPGKSYTATIVEKVGPFRVEFPMRIEVIESEELSYVKALASGSDNRVGSRMKVELDVRLSDIDQRTRVSLVASVDILGKLAALGHSIIKRKADQNMDEFAQAVKQRLEGES